jgi:predicted cupin superfamily sugar epimerase
MIGLYSEEPFSVSCFHRLTSDEIWHVYGGDPFKLILLYPDGSSQEILMGCNPLEGQRVQFVVPANTWQAGYMLPNGRYSLFGCTMAPGFTGTGFEAGIDEDLIAQYPTRAADIQHLSVNGHETRMPEGFAT